jgi:Uma2 family endonuclease
LPDHTQLPESDGTFVKNFQEHPQSLILTDAIEPLLQQLHPDGQYCIGQDSGIYWRLTDPPQAGAEAPDWFYVPGVPPLLQGQYRRSYVLWREKVKPLIVIEFVSGNGAEERDRTPLAPKTAQARPEIKPKKPGKFWVYEQAIQIPFYAIYEVKKAAVEVFQLIDGRYAQMEANARGHYEIGPMGVELGIQYGPETPPIPWLRWWDQGGDLLLTGQERADQEYQARLEAEATLVQERQAKQVVEATLVQERQAKQAAEATLVQERQAKEKLAAYLRSLGLDPEDLGNENLGNGD